MTQQINMTSDEDVRARVDALLAEMTPQEKAGQLTQYFYMDFMRDQSRGRRAEPARDGRDARWPAAASARCCS